MSLPRWSTILDGAWLALSAAAALATALDLGARAGLRVRLTGEAVLTARAAAPEGRPVPARACPSAGAGDVSGTARESPVRTGAVAGTGPASGP